MCLRQEERMFNAGYADDVSGRPRFILPAVPTRRGKSRTSRPPSAADSAHTDHPPRHNAAADPQPATADQPGKFHAVTASPRATDDSFAPDLRRDPPGAELLDH
jgi:hypothetical protein